MNAKLAIALQVCPLDVEQALRLVKLICSIESKRRTDIEFLLAHRRDTDPEMVKLIISEARAKFATTGVIEGKRMSTGWPEGCNDLWAETMMRVSLLSKGRQITATGVLTFEPDCLPLREDWLDALALAWKQAREDGCECIGTALETPPHINGNAIFDARITRKHVELAGSAATVGWDCFHGVRLLIIGRHTKLIKQMYKARELTRAQVEGLPDRPALLHGVKGEAGLALIEEMVADKTFFKL